MTLGIDIDDDLARRAKTLAESRGLYLREMVAGLLEAELRESQEDRPAFTPAPEEWLGHIQEPKQLIDFALS